MSKTISRSDVAKNVFEMLADPDFISRLGTEREDGSKPIVVAMPTDMLSKVLEDVAAAGDCANIIVPRRRGHVAILGMCVNPALSAAQRLGAAWLSDCKMEDLLVRVAEDGGSATYSFSHDLRSEDTAAAVLLDAA